MYVQIWIISKLHNWNMYPWTWDVINILRRLRYWSETRSEWVSILIYECKWIKKLKSKEPYSMSKHRDLLSLIIFSLIYMDKTPAMKIFTNPVKSCYKQFLVNNRGYPTRNLLLYLALQPQLV